MAVQINWNALQSPDIGGAFTSGLQSGQRSRAMSQFDINNPDSVNALLRVDPRAGAQMLEVARQQQQYATRRQVGGQVASGDMAGARSSAAASGDFDLVTALGKMDEQQRAVLKDKAEIIGQAAQFADTPEKWDAAVDWLVQNGHPDLAEYKGKFSPDTRMAAIAQAGQINDYFKQNESYTLAPGSARYDATGKIIAERPFAPQYRSVGEGQSLIEIPGGGGQVGAQGGFGAFYNGFLAPAEGGYAARDGKSGAPVNFGVNQAANPDVDVKNLSQEQAAQLLHDRYWVPSGADQIQDPALQAVHADTAVNMGVGAAKQMLQASGGDAQKYLQLREQRYRQIGGPDLPSWLNRNQKLTQFVGGQQPGGPRVIAQGAPKQGYQMLSPQEAQSLGLDATTRYQRGPNGQVTAVGGQERAGAGRKAETDLRSKFDALPEVKDFKDVRANFQQVQALGLKKGATAQDDIALVFSYMKMLDPGSVVREGEFATAAKAAGVEDRVVNIIQRAESGRILNDEQRAKMVAAAATVYKQRRNTYNSVAEQYRGYAKDYGVKADNVAKRYLPTGENPLRPKSAPLDPSNFRIVARRPK